MRSISQTIIGYESRFSLNVSKNLERLGEMKNISFNRKEAYSNLGFQGFFSGFTIPIDNRVAYFPIVCDR